MNKDYHNPDEYWHLPSKKERERIGLFYGICTLAAFGLFSLLLFLAILIAAIF